MSFEVCSHQAANSRDVGVRNLPPQDRTHLHHLPTSLQSGWRSRERHANLQYRQSKASSYRSNRSLIKSSYTVVKAARRYILENPLSLRMTSFGRAVVKATRRYITDRCLSLRIISLDHAVVRMLRPYTFERHPNLTVSWIVHSVLKNRGQLSSTMHTALT